MDNALYITLSRQAGLFRQMDIIANNVANVNTTAYKAENVLFNKYLVNDVPGRIAFTNDIATVRDNSEGALINTERPLDVAIKGKGYFAVETPLGRRYTRAGNFTINISGQLATPEGYPVLNTSGQPILLEEGDTNFVIRENGLITVDNSLTGSENEERGSIGVFSFDNDHKLKKLSNNLYTTEETPFPATNYVTVGGLLEGSNVKSVKMMTDLINTSRAVGSTAKMINKLYELQNRALATITRQR